VRFHSLRHPRDMGAAEVEAFLSWLANRRGSGSGYCGLEDCASNDDGPERSACVAHDDGNTYRFRVCDDKPECNVNRSEASESNCSASLDFVDPDTTLKACVPPSSD
jgi:hypothetical protein